MKEIYYHEDDYCQIEVLPVSNWQHCAEQMGEIQTFSEAHKAPNGMGWTQMYMRPDNPVGLSHSGIAITALRSALARVAEEYGPVYTGYSTYRELSKNTVAFCAADGAILYADHNDAGVVEHIWLTLDPTTEDQKSRALSLFMSLAEQGEFLLSDWGWCALVMLKDSGALSQYLSKRIEVFSNVRASFKKRRTWWQFWKK
jgi:hypothetical protein